MKTTIIISKDEVRGMLSEYYGDITEELDKHLRNGGSFEYGWRSYIMHHTDNDDGSTIYVFRYVFRVPGATRGCIIVDDKGIIKEFRVYKETGNCYEDAVFEVCGIRVGFGRKSSAMIGE